MARTTHDGAATVRHSAGQMASQRKSALAGNRNKKQNRAHKRRSKNHTALIAVPAKAPTEVEPSATTVYECLLCACGSYEALAKCNNVNDNATTATAIDTVITPKCSLGGICRTETEFEQF